MAKSKVNLSEAQLRKNAEILARLEAEREQLIAETRALQDRTRRRPGRKKKTDQSLNKSV